MDNSKIKSETVNGCKFTYKTNKQHTINLIRNFMISEQPKLIQKLLEEKQQKEAI